MKQIKTIYHRIDFSEKFDREVNEALEEGWELRRRDIIVPKSADKCTLLYAEMEREIITEAERCCENCKYLDYPNTRRPCADCDSDCSCWEEA